MNAQEITWILKASLSLYLVSQAKMVGSSYRSYLINSFNVFMAFVLISSLCLVAWDCKRFDDLISLGNLVVMFDNIKKQVLQIDVDEKRKHKLKSLIPSPNTFFMAIQFLFF